MNVAVEGLSITVAGGRKLLDEVNCVVQAGDMVALMGPSGAGKTTLLNSIVGRTITGLTEGGIYYDGAALSKVRSSVGYVTQDDIMYETLTPRENLTFAAIFILPKLSKESRQKVTEQGCTVVATIHQPSEAVFTRFDKVLLLETGRVAYYGVISGLRGSLGSLGFTCPEGTPLPEILLDLLEVPAEEAARAACTEKLGKLKQLSETSFMDRGSPAKSEAPPKRAGLCGQVVVLFKRELVNVKRNKALTVVRAVQSVASALLIGLIFLQLERNMSSLSPRLFSSFLLVFAQFLFALLGVVNAFPAERAVFLRETQDKLYHPAAFYLAKVSIDTLMQCFFPILVVAISYPLIGFNGESADRVLWFYAIMAVVSNCGAGVGFMVSAAVPSVNLALSIAPGLIMPQLLLSGIFIKVEDLPQPFNALSYLMVARYAVQATVVNEFTCETKSSCDPAVWRQSPADQCDNSPCDFCCTSHEMMAAGGICPVLSCGDALVSLGMDEIWPMSDTSTEETIFFNLIALLVLMVFFRLQGLNILMCLDARVMDVVEECLNAEINVPYVVIGSTHYITSMPTPCAADDDSSFLTLQAQERGQHQSGAGHGHSHQQSSRSGGISGRMCWIWLFLAIVVLLQVWERAAGLASSSLSDSSMQFWKDFMKSAAEPTAAPPSESEGAAEDPTQTMQEASPPALLPVVQSLPQPAVQLPPQTKKPHYDLMIIIPASGSRDRNRMEAVRQTWVRQIDNTTGLCSRCKSKRTIKYFFILGDEATEEEKENRHLRDDEVLDSNGTAATSAGNRTKDQSDIIALSRCSSDYIRLAEKVRKAIRFVTTHFSFRLLLKTDTDSWIFLDTLMAYAEANDLFSRKRSVHAGDVRRGAKPQKPKSGGKNIDEVFNTKTGQDTYPVFAAGCGYLLTRNLCNFIALLAMEDPDLPSLTELPQEDVAAPWTRFALNEGQASPSGSNAF
ncbi:W [Symbiodinium microadriaticum]|nr:W [Symbiodinium microadriaticum] [Symbiodinium microadriaticum]